MKVIGLSFQDCYPDFDNPGLQWRYDAVNLDEGERVLVFEGNTCDASCEAVLWRKSDEPFANHWFARLDRATWKWLSADELVKLEMRELVAPTPYLNESE